MNERLIREILQEYFKEFENYHLIIMVLITVIISLINVAQALFTSRKIETFKSRLKKNEKKYSYYNQLQIKSLSSLFSSITDFKELTEEMMEINNLKPEYYKNVSSQWIESYIQCTKLFSREKYILPIKLKEKYTSLFLNFNSLHKVIDKDRSLQSLYFTNEIGKVELGGDSEDLVEIHEQIKKFDKEGIFKLAISSINDLRKEIENYFEEIENYFEEIE